MNIIRKETWGIIKYDTSKHEFQYVQDKKLDEVPYVGRPVLLNCDLTLECNMACRYCVARDMRKYCNQDLQITNELISKINLSPFMVIVITGGEPLLPRCERSLVELISGLKRKGIIVDTNGCVEPSRKVLAMFLRKKVLVRVSLDSFRIQDEATLRMKRPKKHAWSDEVTKEAYKQKLSLIARLKKAGIHVAIQSVLHQHNMDSILYIPEKLQSWAIDKWFIQRLIPTKSLLDETRYFMEERQYQKVLRGIETVSSKYGIKCFAKKDRRHNCVYLMVGHGEIYTQSDRAGIKIPLGKIGDIEDYFEYVSNSEHAARYYDIPVTELNRKENKER